MKPLSEKILASLSLILMVLCIIPSGAVADDNGTDTSETDAISFEDHFRGKGPMGPGREMQMPEFETEEEELAFVKNGTEKSVERMIEMLENVELDDSSELTGDDIEDLIDQLEDIQNKLADEELTLEDLEEIKEEISQIMETFREAMPAPEGDKEAKPEFETEEEEIEFVKERTTESIDRMIEILENINLEDSEELTNDDIESMISQLEEIKTSLDDEELTLEELKEIKESIFQIMENAREAMPAPEDNGKRMPHHRGPMEGAEEN